MSKNKTVPPMYPKSDSIKLGAAEIVAVDKKTRTVHLQCEGSPPEALLAAIEAERHRWDLIARLRAHKATLMARIEPHCGDRPKHIPAAKWRDFEQRTKLIADLPHNAPGEARDAFLALRTLSILNDALIELRDITPAIRQAVCSAIDLGMLLQRGQTQIDHGAAVDAGKRSVRSRTAANAKKSDNKLSRSEDAFSEFYQMMMPEIVRKDGITEKDVEGMSRTEFMNAAKRTRRTDDFLDQIAKMPLKDEKGNVLKTPTGKIKRKYGSKSVQNNNVKRWKSPTPSE